MAFLHNASLLHRDLKTDNLLVYSLDESAPVNCKISGFKNFQRFFITLDFGTSRGLNKAQETQYYTIGVALSVLKYINSLR